MKKRYVDYAGLVGGSLCLICFCLTIVFIERVPDISALSMLITSGIWTVNFIIDVIKTEISEDSKQDSKDI